MFRPSVSEDWTPWAIAKGQYYRPSNNSFVKFKEQGLAPVPGLSFVNICLSTPRNGGLSPIPSR